MNTKDSNENILGLAVLAAMVLASAFLLAGCEVPLTESKEQKGDSYDISVSGNAQADIDIGNGLVTNQIDNGNANK